MYFPRQQQASERKRLKESVYTPICSGDITNFLFKTIFYKYKYFKKRNNTSSIVKFIMSRKDATSYEIWMFLKTVTEEVVFQLNDTDFSALIEEIRNQSSKFYRKELIEREYEPSKNHPYDVHPTPVYKKDNNGNYFLIKGNKYYSESISSFFGHKYLTQMKQSIFQTNRKVYLNNIEFLHLKKTIC